MSRAIWKYELDKSNSLSRAVMPHPFTPVDFAFQGDTPCLWVAADLHGPDCVPIEFYIAMTGEPVADGWTYFKTFHKPQLGFPHGLVTHLFYRQAT